MTSRLTYRELYCPAHFGNSYEVMSEDEMRAVLQEAMYWGFNAYGDWFDTADLKNPAVNPRNHHLLPQELWDRKLRNFRIAQELGFCTNLVITPNHVFLDQLTPDLLADTTPSRYFGQLLCPSKAEARTIILNNQRDLFEQLRQRGVQLGSIAGCPFDYGGCACPACDPWIVTFGRLFLEIHDLARSFFPAVEARLVGWWWTAEEHERFQVWADEAAPGRFKSMALHLPYGHTAPNVAARLPKGCDRHAFVHIGYGEESQPRDTYGAWGPVVASQRLAATREDLERSGCTGYMAYSEGFFDDINKAVWGGLSSGRWSSPDQVLKAYAFRYWEAPTGDAGAWADWMSEWGRPWSVDVEQARVGFDALVARLPGPPDGDRSRFSEGINPRLAQLEAKLRLFQLHDRITRIATWSPERLALAKQFFAEREWVQRHVWGLGPVRHALHQRYHPPSWLEEWKAATAARAAGEDLGRSGAVLKEA